MIILLFPFLSIKREFVLRKNAAMFSLAHMQDRRSQIKA